MHWVPLLTILAIREVGLPRGGFAQVLSRCGCGCESQLGRSWSAGRGDGLLGVLVSLRRREAVPCGIDCVVMILVFTGHAFLTARSP